MTGTWRLIVLAALGSSACVPSDGPTMRPGDDCLRCHGNHPGGTDEAGPVQKATFWSLAGTVYSAFNSDPNSGIEGAHVEITDNTGFSFDLETNLVGNFYSAESVAFPLQRVCVTSGGATRCMEDPAPNGACNYCHTQPPPTIQPPLTMPIPGRICSGPGCVLSAGD